MNSQQSHFHANAAFISVRIRLAVITCQRYNDYLLFVARMFLVCFLFCLPIGQLFAEDYHQSAQWRAFSTSEKHILRQQQRIKSITHLYTRNVKHCSILQTSYREVQQQIWGQQLRMLNQQRRMPTTPSVSSSLLYATVAYQYAQYNSVAREAAAIQRMIREYCNNPDNSYALWSPFHAELNRLQARHAMSYRILIEDSLSCVVDPLLQKCVQRNLTVEDELMRQARTRSITRPIHYIHQPHPSCVYSPEEGEVIFKRSVPGHNYVVAIRTHQHYLFYTHLRSIYVDYKNKVMRGECIGISSDYQLHRHADSRAKR